VAYLRDILQRDWTALERSFPFALDMAACMQDPVFHAEGDVWTHTKMVASHIPDNGALLLAALFHDVAKPMTREVDGDRIRHPNHSRIGAKIAWQELWKLGVDLETRLSVFWICLWHQRILHFFDRDQVRDALTYGSVASWDNLITFARADISGRIAPDIQKSLDNLDLVKMFIDEQGDIAKNWSPASRMEFIEKPDRSPYYEAQEPAGSRVIVMSGFPGAGKDTYIKTALSGLPVVSLDDIRTEMKVLPSDDQGRVIQAAQELAKVYLRKKAPFVWNATNVSKSVRQKSIGLCRKYDAHVSIHALDRPLDIILKQNKDRKDAVPEKIIYKLIDKWEPPTLLEAHEVKWV
jgi:predicted kinase